MWICLLLFYCTLFFDSFCYYILLLFILFVSFYFILLYFYFSYFISLFYLFYFILLYFYFIYFISVYFYFILLYFIYFILFLFFIYFALFLFYFILLSSFLFFCMLVSTYITISLDKSQLVLHSALPVLPLNAMTGSSQLVVMIRTSTLLQSKRHRWTTAWPSIFPRTVLTHYFVQSKVSEREYWGA